MIGHVFRNAILFLELSIELTVICLTYARASKLNATDTDLYLYSEFDSLYLAYNLTSHSTCDLWLILEHQIQHGTFDLEVDIEFNMLHLAWKWTSNS